MLADANERGTCCASISFQVTVTLSHRYKEVGRGVTLAKFWTRHKEVPSDSTRSFEPLTIHRSALLWDFFCFVILCETVLDGTMQKFDSRSLNHSRRSRHHRHHGNSYNTSVRATYLIPLWTSAPSCSCERGCCPW